MHPSKRRFLTLSVSHVQESVKAFVHFVFFTKDERLS